MHLSGSLANPLAQRPILIQSLPFPSHSITHSCKLPLPCGECARALPFYLFCLCSINLSVEPTDAVRVSCILNSKNNRSSVTRLGSGVLEREKRGACVYGCRWGVLEEYMLSGIRLHQHCCVYNTVKKRVLHIVLSCIHSN